MKVTLITLSILFTSIVALAHGGGGGTGGLPPYKFTAEGMNVCKLSEEEAEEQLAAKQLKRWVNLCNNK